MARVAIAPLTAADADDFVAAARASRSLHGEWVSPPATLAEFTVLLRRTEEQTVVSLLARRREDAAVTGYFNLSQLIRGPLQQAFLGYAAFAPHAGRGYATEALGLVLEHAFGPLGLHRIEANIQPGNEASLALVRRCGFVQEGFSERYLRIAGQWRDHERWAIRAEQWQQQARAAGGGG